MNKKFYAFLIMAVVVVGWSKTVLAAKTFVYCSEASPKIFNPQLAVDGPTFNASSRPLYNRLVEFAPGSTKIVPSLAKSWQVSEGGKVYTFKLRNDVIFHTTEKFSPRRKFNADDVIFSFDRMRKKDHPYHLVNGGTYEYFNSMGMGGLIKDIKKIDADTVQFVLAHAEAPFIANMAMDFASILSAEYATALLKEGRPERLDLEPVGTGPFRLKRYDKDNMIRFERHPEYFEGPSPLDQLVFAITPDSSVRFQKLKAGECHLVAEPAPADIADMSQQKNIKVVQGPGLNIGYLAFNVEKKPFDNVLVRRAVHHALNRKAYVEAIYMGHAQVAKNPIPPTMWGYNSSVSDYEYNPTKAKELLKQAGLPNGFESELWTLPVSRPYNPNGKKLGEMMQADLAAVGIKVKLITYKWGTYLDKAAKGEHQMLQMGWVGDNGDPDNFLHQLLSCSAVSGGSNYSRWCYEEFSKLVQNAKSVSDMKQRAALYQKAQVIFKSQAPWVTLAHATAFRALSHKVQGYKLSPFGTETFYGIDLK